jgi:hypothetical protein
MSVKSLLARHRPNRPVARHAQYAASRIPTKTAQVFRDQANAAIGPIAEEIAALAGVRAALKERAESSLALLLAEYRTRVAEPARVLQERAEAAIAPIAARYAADVTDAGRALRERAQPVLDAIAEDLRDRGAAIVENMAAVDVVGDEDEDPFFDSARDYVEQIGRYKQHQAKPTGFKVPALKPYVCENCGGSFTSVRPAKWCSPRCREKQRPRRRIPQGARIT